MAREVWVVEQFTDEWRVYEAFHAQGSAEANAGDKPHRRVKKYIPAPEDSNG